MTLLESEVIEYAREAAWDCKMYEREKVHFARAGTVTYFYREYNRMMTAAVAVLGNDLDLSIGQWSDEE